MDIDIDSGISHRRGSVSYTHLDVYKRQHILGQTVKSGLMSIFIESRII